MRSVKTSLKTPLLLILSLLSISCTQVVHVKTQKPAKNIKLEKYEVQNELAKIPTGIGPVFYDITYPTETVISGKLQRTELNMPVVLASVGASIITIPLLATFGMFLANPSWKYAPLISLRGGGQGAVASFMNQTMSPFTIPVTYLFAIIGSMPLFLGLLASEKLPDITHHLPMSQP